MRIKVYMVDVALPLWLKRVLALAAATAAATVAVVAAASVPNSFTDGDTLSAAKLNANFGALTSQLDTVQQTMVAKDSRGYVGIGTSNPESILQVNASPANFDLPGSIGQLVTIRRPNPATDAQGISFRMGAGSDYLIGRLAGSDDLSFGVTYGEAFKERVRFSANGNVGIGKTDPAFALDVNGRIRALGNDGRLFLRASSRPEQWALVGTTAGDFRIVQVDGEGNSVRDCLVAKQTTGVIGIGTESPQYTLDVAGSIRGDNLTPSDRSLKKNIMPLPADTLGRVQTLQAVTFTWDQHKTSGYSTKPQMGLIAQDVEKVFPSLVETDGKGIKSIHYMGVTAVLLEAVKAQQRQIEELKSQVRTLENRLSPSASAAKRSMTSGRTTRSGVL